MLEIPEDDAFALGLALNRHRRHLTPEQQKQILEDLHQDKERLKRLCLALCEKMPQDRVSFELAVPQQTISDWLNGDINNTGIGKASKPDWRVKLSPENKLLLIKKALAGENQKVLADEYKISQQRVTLRSKLGKSRYRRQPTSPSLKNTSVLILSKVHGLLHPLDLLGRRNLTPSQKAALAVELEKQ
jgi:hypothetical protein